MDPHQLLGIEVNPRAAAITDLVLWIGFLQWHFRTHGKTMPAQPVLRSFHNIESRDAVLAYDRKEPVLDEQGQPVTRWDGHTMKKHPVTGEDVPDDTAKVPLYRFVNPRKAEWPKADYVVGNPPFIGNKRMRAALGDGFVQTLRETHQTVPETADFVFYWWNHAANLARSGEIKRFGFITTNTISQTFNRGVVQAHLKAGFSIVFAIPDHPWVDSGDGAAVRIAMTVGQGGGDHLGVVAQVVKELDPMDAEIPVVVDSHIGKINSMLNTATDVSSVSKLKANERLSYMGVILCGDGFFVDQPEAIAVSKAALAAGVVARYVSGTDLAKTARGRLVIDFHGLSDEDARERCPEAYQWLVDRVRPFRMQSLRKNHRINWWIYGESRPGMRGALKSLARFIATARTAKFRIFQFVPKNFLVESNVIAVASEDAFYLGVLSSRQHVVWASHAGATLEDRPHYTNTTTFEPFPFPHCSPLQKRKVSELGDALDEHRKRQQLQCPTLTITDMYNVLEKLRSGEPLTDKEKRIHEQGLVSVLKQIHDDLDQAVFDAYGWPADLSDEQILERLVALNAERAAEEERGLIRWLRPEFQNPQGDPTVRQTELELPTTSETPVAAGPKKKTQWPKSLAEQAQAVRAALASHTGAVSAAQLAASFSRASKDRIEELLETLATLGQAREVEEGKYVG